MCKKTISKTCLMAVAILLIGVCGLTSAQSLEDTWTQIGSTWTQKTNMLTVNSLHSSAVVDGKIYVVGGNGGAANDVAYANVEAYDPTTNTWTRKTGMPTARTLPAAVTVDGKIYVMGGVWGGVQRLDAPLRFTIRQQTHGRGRLICQREDGLLPPT